MKGRWIGHCLAGAFLLFAGCRNSPDRVAGGGSETEYFTLSGTLSKPDGKAAGAARVRIRPAAYLANPEFPPRRGEVDTVADALGSFHVTGLPAGEYLVEAGLGDSLGLMARTYASPFSETIVRGRLQATGLLRVTIASPDAALDYHVQIYGMERRALVDTLGNAQVTLPPGEYRVRISGNTDRRAAQEYSGIIIQAGRDTSLAPLPASGLGNSPPVPILYDCNIGDVTDDAGGLAVLHGLASLGEARILAVSTSEPSRKSAAALDAIDTYYGHPEIPVGTWKGGKPAAHGAYDSLIAAEFPQDLPDWDSIPEAAALYRRILSEQPDGQAVMYVAGPPYNAWALLRLDRDLVARKVKELVIVGGVFPSGRESNFANSIARDTLPNVAAELVRDWPTPITYHDFNAGRDAQTGACLARAPAANPVKRIYELVLGGPGRTYGSWDLAPLLYAVRGTGSIWSKVSEGSNAVAADGSNQWLSAPDADQAYLVLQKSPDSLAAALDTLLCKVPGP